MQLVAALQAAWQALAFDRKPPFTPWTFLSSKPVPNEAHAGVGRESSGAMLGALQFLGPLMAFLFENILTPAVCSQQALVSEYHVKV